MFAGIEPALNTNENEIALCKKEISSPRNENLTSQRPLREYQNTTEKKYKNNNNNKKHQNQISGEMNQRTMRGAKLMDWDSPGLEPEVQGDAVGFGMDYLFFDSGCMGLQWRRR